MNKTQQLAKTINRATDKPMGTLDTIGFYIYATLFWGTVAIAAVIVAIGISFVIEKAWG